MGQPLLLEQVLEARRPAYSEGLLYRYVPDKGFQRATLLRALTPLPWLAMAGTPALDEPWYHERSCDCRFCQPPAATLEEAKESGRAAA